MNWARANWTWAGTARTDWARTGHGHGYGTRHEHGRIGHGWAGHGRIVSEHHRYPLVIINVYNYFDKYILIITFLVAYNFYSVSQASFDVLA
jgi:hypothetical protein